ncbi:CHAD domain-containing protein [Pelagicoccus mobilis]|uniref:CHAD domain-containing protein n=1 Tax=Pelagicoccus mobilis TaxID=415221 RepID=A0A934VQW9_9BACT|nr:CHAD domain-containing protein [Pelagicoccus mobilis]MBK1877340.1 CHAD domain-containing protein [Pelagicoccus mobilis]
MLESRPQLRWRFNPSDLESILEALSATGSIHPGKDSSSSIEIFDSFDQCLRQADLFLLRQRGLFYFSFPDGETPPELASKARKQGNGYFWQDFESPVAQAILKKHLKLRAVTRIANAKSETKAFELRNGDDKIISRIQIETITCPGRESTLSVLILSPLRGYEEESNLIALFLDAASELDRDVPSTLDWVLAESGQNTPPPSPSQAIQLSPEQSVQTAVTEIASFMIQTARRSEDGIKADIDTEYLHDYRVSIRKLRSVLSLIKGAYSKEETRHLKAQFAELARATNRLRDLDVYLLEETAITLSLPDYLQPGLERMFTDFRAERVQELQRIRRHLRSKKYAATVEELASQFETGDQPEGKRSHLPIGQVAAAEILAHYQRVSTLGSAINDQTPDDEVHELRIECKKLRYLLELFSSLFPPKEIKTIIKQLKGLQNTLGDFNDYCVQQVALSDYLEKTPRLGRNTAAALGGLISHLHRKQVEARSHVSERFIQFNDSKMKTRFKRTFKKSRKERI